jgi:hypothetical protein
MFQPIPFNASAVFFLVLMLFLCHVRFMRLFGTAGPNL